MPFAEWVTGELERAAQSLSLAEAERLLAPILALPKPRRKPKS
jgi:hypothetical protein